MSGGSEMTKAEAIRLADSKFWEPLGFRERAEFQLQEPMLCMPFNVFQEAIGKALGRGVYTHEFADPKSLLAELRGESPARTLQDILALIPADKLIVLEVP